MKKIVTILGARPQFIKAAILSNLFLDSKFIKEFILHTGQHYDFFMSDVFFSELNIPYPDINLSIGSGNHGEQTGKMLIEIERYLIDKKPDLVIVYGDTNSTLAGALAAAKLHIPVAHIEAGLRSFNNEMPEEINRILTDRISSLLFAPTDVAVLNLEKEGVDKNIIFQSGDVMYDIALKFSKLAEIHSKILQKLNIKKNEYILATIHRAENTDNLHRLNCILNIFNNVSQKIKIVFPVHPRTRKIISEQNITLSDNILVINPVGYLDMVSLEKNATIIMTDSGGVQKEAYFYKVPCITLRKETEWVELVNAKWNYLLEPLNVENALNIIKKIIWSKNSLNYVQFYGSGNASENIFRVLLDKLNKI